MARKLKIMETEKHTLKDLKNDLSTEKLKKIKNAHCRTRNMAKN
jgi:hypothetical protein